MSQDRELPQQSIDFDAFGSALNAGALDTCLIQLRQANNDGQPDAELNCRLAEALLHRGRHDEAVECCRRAIPRLGLDTAMLRICAWVFSNSECYDEAACAYRRLVELCPDWIEGHRHASGALAAIGQIDEAIVHATSASDLAPRDPEFALHAGSLLLAARRPEDAARFLGRAMALEPDNPRVLGELSAACDALGQNDQAVALALQAVALTPDDNCCVINAAELLMRRGRADEAAELLEPVAANAADPRLLRVLSAAEMLRGRLDAALAAIDRALACTPDTAEYQVHRGHLLWQLGDIAGAALALDRAAARDPTGSDIKRAQMSLFLAAGLMTEATAAGGELLHRFPDEKGSAEAVLHLLNHRLGLIEGEYTVLSDGTGRAPRPPRPPPGWRDRLRSQRRVIAALVIRETRTRFADSKLGYGWALIEPILHITLLSATFSLLMHGQPPIGTHFFIFYYTGLVRYSGADGTKTYPTRIPNGIWRGS